MARLTTFSRLLIVLAIIAGLFFLAKKYLPQFTGGGGTTTETPATPSTGGETPAPATPSTPSGGSGSTSATDGAPGAAFNYTAPVPVGGKMKGVAVLGATGFDMFIVTIDGQNNYKLEKAEFGSSLVHENMATEEDTKAGLRRYIQKMLDYGVGGKDIHFVVSSGASKEESAQKISKALTSMKYVVNEVTPEQEAKYALRAAQPKGYESRSFVVDIGSGNTKIAWMYGGTVSTHEAAGAKYSQKGISDESVYQDVKQKVGNIPSSHRSTCFIIGGVPFELAKQHRNGKERYTVLRGPGGYKADGAKQKCGLNIYQAIADATGCKQFVFDWDANFTIGFLMGVR